MDLWSDTNGVFCAPGIIPGHTVAQGSIQEQLSTSHGTQWQQWVGRPVQVFLDSEPSYSPS